MNKEELANTLNGIVYRSNDWDNRWTRAIDEARNNNLVIATGYSDDLLELDGSWREEIGAIDGVVCRVDKDGPPVNPCDSESCPHFVSRINNMKHWVKAEWCPSDVDCSWRITASVPFASFDIIEDGKVYCRGCVFCVEDIE